MRRFYCTLIICLVISSLTAQKLVKKSLLNSGISHFQIDTANCYHLELAASGGNELIVEAIIDGEYHKDMVIKINETGNTVIIGSGFRPNFINPNDKLSAHKVISVALKISLPEYHHVLVLGTNCNVEVSGAFTSLNITLDDGRCVLYQVKENVEVNTQSGDISLFSSNGVVMATTKFGQISGEELPKGDSSFTLNSVSGNIHLVKTQ